jgi:hypothetical protein
VVSSYNTPQQFRIQMLCKLSFVYLLFELMWLRRSCTRHSKAEYIFASWILPVELAIKQGTTSNVCFPSLASRSQSASLETRICHFFTIQVPVSHSAGGAEPKVFYEGRCQPSIIEWPCTFIVPECL